MTPDLTLALLAAGSALIGSLITGLLTYRAGALQRDFEKLRRRLRDAYSDITGFYRLEEMYTEALADDERSAEAIKRAFRRRLREESDGAQTVSEDATPRVCAQRLRDLG